MDAFRLFDVCCSCPLQFFGVYLLFCTEPILWLESLSERPELSYNLSTSYDINLLSCFFL